MHKRKYLKVFLVALSLICIPSGISIANLAPGSAWLNQDLSLQKQADTANPSATYPNLDCSADAGRSCVVPADYGAADTNSEIRLNNEGIALEDKGGFVPVYTYLENRQRFFPVPNSNEAISYTSGPAIGSNIYFNHSLSSSIVKTGGLGTLLPEQYHINRPPDGKLADQAGHLMPADIASIGFSGNGRWMVVSDPNVAVMRVNLVNFEVTPFAAGFNYLIGLDPAARTAITNDGRYAVVASQNFNIFKLYDLTTCSTVPNAISGPVACQSRDLQSLMQKNVAGYSFVNSIRFMNDDTLTLYAAYKVDGAVKTARFIISDSGDNSQLDYLALGDSYISGEGAFDYIGGTDTNTNNCHLSYVSYPLLAGKDLNYNSYHSVACSGATTDDIINDHSEYVSQADKKDRVTRAVWDENGQSQTALSSFLPGYVNQLEFVRRYQPKAVTVSIGGNDAGLIGTLKTCFSPGTCMDTYEDRLVFVQNIKNHFNDIEGAYSFIKNAGPPDMRVYSVGYPQVAKPGGDCGLNVQLNSDEILFASQAIDYLNSVIKAAAAKTGVFYVDASDALYGHRLCEAKPGSVAVNGITAGNDKPDKLGGPIGNESFHPNAFGHELLENRLLEATHNLKAPMPAPDLSAAAPTTDGLEILNVPHSGRPIKAVEFDDGISDDLVYKGVPADVNIAGASHSLPASTSLSAELHSDPISLGSFTADLNGDLSIRITIPETVPAGYHTLHFFGKDLTGQPVDIYKTIYVAGSADDMDDNGVPDIQQECVGVEAAGVDDDQDGIDDACDGDITLPPAGVIQPAAVKKSSVESNPVFISSTPATNLSSPFPLRAVNPVSPARPAGSKSSPKVLGASVHKSAAHSASGQASGRSLVLLLCGLGVLVAVSLVLGLL